MMKKFKKENSNLPTPSNISMNWNMGSLLGTFSMFQILSGLMLSMYYSPTKETFLKCMMMNRNMNTSLLIKNMHITTVSIIFMFLFMHINRNMMFNSFKSKKTWMIGWMILMMMMASAFLGYVLPWGQMSLWGATVITNLISTIPIWGENLCKMLWGNFSMDTTTLNRFFSMHFLTPIMMIPIMIMHMSSLHKKGSSNQLNLNSNMEKSFFHPIFSIKDTLYILTMMLVALNLILMNNKMFMEEENFNQANYSKTPIHIKPEWYFLFAYAILRTIPNKLGGVMMMFSSITMLILLPYSKKKKNSKMNFKEKMKSMLFTKTFIMLSYLGSKQIESPYMLTSKIYTTIYFSTLMMKL